MKVFTPPPDKSITLRALLLGAIADGTARVEKPLYCEDTEAAIACLKQLGVRVCRDGGALIVEGHGLKGLKKPDGPLNAGESGTLARLLAGILAGQAFPSELTGRGTLLNRPMAPVAAALARLGAKIRTNKDRLPLLIRPAKLKGRKISGVTSAQIKSALLLAGLYAAGETEVKEPTPTRDHTERLLALLGADIASRGRSTVIKPGQLTARPLNVPGDISSAAPFIAAALLSENTIVIKACGLNPARLGFVSALEKMGAGIKFKIAETFPEPYGEIEVRPSALKSAKFGAGEIPAMIDEIPLLAVLAGRARGTTVITGIEGLRAKESDRLEATLALLACLGVKAAYKKGRLAVTGAKRFKAVSPVDPRDDHRIAMAAAAASAACPDLKIKNPGCVNKSYPGFWKDFKKVFSLSFS